MSVTTGMYLDSIIFNASVNASPNVSFNEYGILYMTTTANNIALVSDVIRENFDLSVLEFYVMHFLAGVIPLTLSLATGTFMLLFILCRGTKLCRRSIGDRMTVYLAVCDLCYGLQDLNQHIYLITMKEPLPDLFCAFAGEYDHFSLVLAQ